MSAKNYCIFPKLLKYNALTVSLYMHVLFHLDLTTMIALTGMLVHSLSVAIKRSIMVTEVAEARKVCTEKACYKEQQTQ